jgi:dihydroflavonol-4-reductase
VSEKLVLVTGATGCIGSILVRRLLGDGARIAILKRPADRLGGLTSLRTEFEVRFGDVTDAGSLPRAMRGVETIFHLAGVVAPLNRLAARMWEVNVVGAYNVAQAALQARVDRLVHTSSIAAIGYPPDYLIADESFPSAESVVETAYSITKRRGEALVLGLAQFGLDVVVVNPSAVLAPGGDPKFSWTALIDAAARRRLRAVPAGGTAVCTAHDLVDGQCKAMNLGRSGQRYILSTANISYSDLGRLITAEVHVSPPVTRAPAWALAAAGHVNAGLAALHHDPYASSALVPENVALMTRRLYYDQSRAVRELGLTQSPLEPAIQEMARWWRRTRQGDGADDGTA